MLAVCKGGVAVDIYVKFSDHFFLQQMSSKVGEVAVCFRDNFLNVKYTVSKKLFIRSFDLLLEALIFYYYSDL